MPLKVIKFEDSKSDPTRMMHKDILSFIDVNHATRISDALDGSSFHNARQAMQKMESITGKKYMTTRQGQVNEWIHSYRGIEKINQSSLIKDILIDLEYYTNGQQEERPKRKMGMKLGA